VWVSANVCVASAQGVFDERPHWLGHDVNATSRHRCVVTTHGKAGAGSWRDVDGGGGGTAVVRPLVWAEAWVVWGVCAWVRVASWAPGPRLITGEASWVWSQGQGAAGLTARVRTQARES
jgi:hypothetical protein